jgi:hypothetical protein
MKKMILAIIAIVFFSAVVNAQVLTPIQYKTLKFYNEAGTQVTATSAYLTGAASAIGDTLTSEAIYLDADEYKWSLALSTGDSHFANAHIQLCAGHVTGTGFYAKGGIAMTTKIDSIISLGTRTQVVGQTVKLLVTNYPTGRTSTAGGYLSNRDSTWSDTYPSIAAGTGAYSHFRIILIPHGPTNDVSNATILNNNLLVIRRFR